ELGGLYRDHLGLEGLQALVAGRGDDRVVIILRLVLPRAGLLLDEQVLDRFDVLVGVGRDGRGLLRERLLGRFSVLEIVVVVDDLIVFERFVDVFHRAASGAHQTAGGVGPPRRARIVLPVLADAI